MRAGVDDREIVSAIGINIDRLFVLVSALASFLAGMAGVVGGAFLTLYPGAEWEILIYALVVVIFGGLGSLEGAMIGALIVGLLDAYGRWLLPEFSYFVLFGPMAILLLFRPQRHLRQGRLSVRPYGPASSSRWSRSPRRCWRRSWPAVLDDADHADATSTACSRSRSTCCSGTPASTRSVHASFFAVAAYTTAILQVRYGQPTLVAAPAGFVAGTLLAVLYGVRRAHARGLFHPDHDRARATSSGAPPTAGRRSPAATTASPTCRRPPSAASRCQSQTAYYYFVLAVVILCAAGYRILVRSPFGLSLRGIKGSESRMRSLGYRTTLHLYAAFVLSGAIASLAGVLYVYYNRFVNPVAASFHISVEVSLMAIVGGSGTIIGPFIGAGIILGMRNWVSSFFELHAAVMGLVFIVTILWAPDGIVGFLERLRVGQRQAEERAGHDRRGRGRGPRQGVRRLARRRRRVAQRRARRAARADRARTAPARPRCSTASPARCGHPPAAYACSATT